MAPPIPRTMWHEEQSPFPNKEFLTGREVAFRLQIEGRGIERSYPAGERLQLVFRQFERRHPAAAVVDDVPDLAFGPVPEAAAVDESRTAIGACRAFAMTTFAMFREQDLLGGRRAGRVP